MKSQSLKDLGFISSQIIEKIPYLKMLVLFGSRARGDTHAKSDWDFAALFDEELRKIHVANNTWKLLEVPQIIGEVFNLNSDQIDVVELNNCSHIITHFVAKDGKLIYEKEPGEFERFCQKALKSEIEIKAIRKSLRQKVEENLQRWGV
ncbi:nucleotidyltransferase domain-containing protein [Kamptonema animale CS-326]|jgi:predicted nucleotidyltransferase|uniref:type VII toxin-antitoxin system MntA family adenylyltransferase antitoxin n=1 Tax=Kamptonema animale TaxID=92934 RepID=UPI0023302AE3|nr:nucleotidyltransferase domain-containing protein [Kamptonema animale]MDB9510084.1 nucleotidyltransferase domain-containing protein [Kamptonema animale CS-326]